jgi:hypothetical protein
MIKITALALAAASALITGSSPESWTATLAGKNGSMVTGTATAEAVGNDSTRVTISVRGAPSSAMLPWHIHNGPCSAATTVLGSESGYPKLQVSGTGTAEGSAVLAVKLSRTASYAVQVHRDATAPTMKDDAKEATPGSDVLSCGDLKPANPVTPQQ